MCGPFTMLIMAASKANKYWQLAKGFAVGNEKKYQPEELWIKAIDYFKWVEENPLKEAKVFGSGFKTEIGKMRAMTITGFCVYAGITTTTFGTYSNDKAYLDIITRIKDIIFSQKFEGAAAGLLEGNIISRELGLRERQELTGKDGEPLLGRLEVIIVRSKQDIEDANR